MEVQGFAAAAARRGAGLPGPDPALRRAGRALGVQERGAGRLWARLRGASPAAPCDRRRCAIVGAQTKGAKPSRAASAREASRVPRPGATRPRSCSSVALWLAGFLLRPDFWGSLDNCFNLPLAFTEIALVSVGLTFVIANGDIDLSVGSVLALSGAIAAFMMKELGADPLPAVVGALVAGTLRRRRQRPRSPCASACPPSWRRSACSISLAALAPGWSPGGSSRVFPRATTSSAATSIEALRYSGVEPESGFSSTLARPSVVQTILLGVVALIAAIVLGKTVMGQMVYAMGGNVRAARYAGIDTGRALLVARLLGLVRVGRRGSSTSPISALQSFGGPASRARRHRFGGHRRRLDLRRLRHGHRLAGRGGSDHADPLAALAPGHPPRRLVFVMPQHWVNVFIGVILIAAVLGDIWLRQESILALVTAAWPGASLQRRQA